MSFSQLRDEWSCNIRGDLLAGMVVALALIPEAIAFSIIAGVDPKVGLYASFCISVVISLLGGRPGMISAATGAMALVMVSLVKDYGINYLFAATILTGFLQVVAGALRLGTLLRFISRSVMTGFVNALAILIFLAQLPELYGAGWETYAMVAVGLGIIYLFPYLTRAVPSPLVAIVVLTAVSVYFGVDVRTVGDMGELPSALPVFSLPELPLTWETLRIILPYSLTLMAVGLLESLMTAVIVDDMTDSPSQKNRECAGQGVANIVAGCFGGMAGCAMIGQSVINVKSGGRGRLSTLFAGLFLLFLILVLGDAVKQIPIPVLVAVMIMVSIGTFNWSSIKNLRTHPVESSLVMTCTVVVVVLTHDLAMGVGVGILMSAVFFARKVSRVLTISMESGTGAEEEVYTILGQVFFASAGQFSSSFDFTRPGKRITIDLHGAHLWDYSAVGALDKVVLKFRERGAEVLVLGLNEASATLVDRLGVYPTAGAVSAVPGH